jgi:hypothetical protein
MQLRLRQLCLVSQDKGRTVAELASILDMRPVHGSGDLSVYGLPSQGPMFEGGRRVLAELGVENLVFAAGTDFLEVLFPTREDSSTVRFMHRRGGDTGYMVIFQADDVGLFARRARAEGVRVVHEGHFPNYYDIHLHPKDTGGALLSVARHAPHNVPNGPWYPAGSAWEMKPPSGVVGAIVAAEFQSNHPEALAERWGRLLDIAVEQDAERCSLKLDDGVLRFVEATDGRGEGFSGFDVKVRDRARIAAAAAMRGTRIEHDMLMICGMRVGLVD